MALPEPIHLAVERFDGALQVLANHVDDERTTVQRAVEHLGEGELGLQDRHLLVEHAGNPVGTAEGVRQPPQPLAQQRVDARRSETAAQLLHALGVGTGEDAVVQWLEGDARPGRLSLQVLVTV